jgi:hypothetical protein
MEKDGGNNNNNNNTKNREDGRGRSRDLLLLEEIIEDGSGGNGGGDSDYFLEYVLNRLGIDIMCGLDDFHDIIDNNKKNEQSRNTIRHYRGDYDEFLSSSSTSRAAGYLIVPRPTTTTNHYGVRNDGGIDIDNVEYYKFPKIHTSTDDIFANSTSSPLLLWNIDEHQQQQHHQHRLGNKTSSGRTFRVDPFIDEHDELMLCDGGIGGSGNNIIDLCEPPIELIIDINKKEFDNDNEDKSSTATPAAALPLSVEESEGIPLKKKVRFKSGF